MGETVKKSLKIDWNEVLVIHIRQGDVMSMTYPPHRLMGHSQPPCTYYEDVIETGYINGGAFPYVLIVTNPQTEDVRINPCVQYIQDRYSSSSSSSIINYEGLTNSLTLVDSHAGTKDDIASKFLRFDLHILTQ